VANWCSRVPQSLPSNPRAANPLRRRLRAVALLNAVAGCACLAMGLLNLLNRPVTVNVIAGVIGLVAGAAAWVMAATLYRAVRALR
jgi:hypothetical protein